jgi:hypothetical protein
LFSACCLSLLLVSCCTHPAAPPAAQVQRFQNGVLLNNGNLHVKVQFYADDTVRVLKWGPGGIPEKASLVVIQTNLPDLNIHIQVDAGTVTLSSENITLELSKSDGAIQYLNARNQIILKEQGGAMITPVRIKHETKAFSVDADAGRRDIRPGTASIRVHELSRTHRQARAGQHPVSHTVPGFHPGLRPAVG